jgi:hypothetical protein
MVVGVKTGCQLQDCAQGKLREGTKLVIASQRRAITLRNVHWSSARSRLCALQNLNLQKLCGFGIKKHQNLPTGGIQATMAFLLILMSGSAFGLDLLSAQDTLPQPWQPPLRFGRVDDNNQKTNSVFKSDFKFNVFDGTQPASGSLQGFSATRKNWEQNSVNDMRINFSTSDNRVQFSMRQSQSQYFADPDYLRVLASRNTSPNSPGKERFFQKEGTEGAAALQRFDAKLLDSNLLGISAFAYRSQVDGYYESFVSTKAKDEFATSNRTSEAVGTKLRFSSIWITSAYINSQRLDGVGGSPTEARHDQTIGLDFKDLRTRMGESIPSLFWLMAPSGIYASNSIRETSFKTTAEGPPDRTTMTGAGAYWNWDSGSANIGYWNYYLDSRRVGAASYDSAGRGLDANVGVYKGPISLYSGISLRKLDDLAPMSQSVSRSYDAYTSLVYRLLYFPDLLLDGSVGRYGYDSRVYGITNDTGYWSVTFGLDYSKFLWKLIGAKQLNAPKDTNNPSPGLKLFYRYFKETDHGIPGVTSGDNHLIGTMFRTGFF